MLITLFFFGNLTFMASEQETSLLIRGIINDWFRSYLTHRKQIASNGTYTSDSETTPCGVSQGSVLGPLLFSNSSKHFSFYLFADDTSIIDIIYANKNLRNLEQIVNTELSNVCDWLLAKKLTLNFKKSNYIIFHPRQRCLTYNPSIKGFR